MMKWLVDNFAIVISLMCLMTLIILVIHDFINLPTDKQLAKLKEWLIWACVEAEKNLQSGTGQIKLREVYNKFCNITAFSSLVSVITFDKFSELVDEALVKVKSMLSTNISLADYVYGNNAVTEMKKLKEQLKEGTNE